MKFHNGSFARQVSCLLRSCENCARRAQTSSLSGMAASISSAKQLLTGPITVPSCTSQRNSSEDAGLAGQGRKQSTVAAAATSAHHRKSSRHSSNRDLQTFLEVMNSGVKDVKEVRYWLKQFTKPVQQENQEGLFAVVQVDSEVLKDPAQLESLTQCITFLNRCSLKCVIVHGIKLDQNVVSDKQFKVNRRLLGRQSRLISEYLEAHNGVAHPLFVGSTVLHANPDARSKLFGNVTQVDKDAIEWSLQSGHIPVIPCIGESEEGQLLFLDSYHVTAAISKLLCPRKVMFINPIGGIRDSKQEVIANINIPADLPRIYAKAWCTEEVKERVNLISDLLHELPHSSSIVINAATTILTELFTHHGSGTFFKITEPIKKYTSLDTVDKERLGSLLRKSFGRDLKSDYMANLESKLKMVYLSEKYNAAAIITQEAGIDMPYLCKFAVSLAKQGEGMADLLWTHIQQDLPSLFWRSRCANQKINTWYFKKCDGSVANGEYIVYWYGDEQNYANLVDTARRLPGCFKS